MTKPFVMRDGLGKEIKKPFFIKGVNFLTGKLMTIEQFRIHVKEGNLNDGDGFGYLGMIDKESNVYIMPSDMEDGNVFPEWATHVIWYDK